MKNQPVRYSPRENAAYIGIFFAFLLLNLCASNLYPEEDHITLVSTLLLLLPHVLLWGLFLVLHLCLRRKIRQLRVSKRKIIRINKRRHLPAGVPS